MSHPDETPPHRLFAAIVMMGTGITLGCGGISQTASGQSHGGSSGNAGVAGGGAAGAGGGAALSTGGSNIIIIGTGDPEPTPVEPGPFACPPARWNCPEQTCGLVANGWALPDDCQCDPLRPEHPQDCAANEIFVCRRGTSTADARPLTEDVPFDCHCVERSMYSCHNECSLAFGEQDASCDRSDDALSAVCGCAVVFLK